MIKDILDLKNDPKYSDRIEELERKIRDRNQENREDEREIADKKLNQPKTYEEERANAEQIRVMFNGVVQNALDKKGVNQ